MVVDDEGYNVRGKLHHVWYLVSLTLFVKGINYMPRSLKVSHPKLSILYYSSTSITILSENLLAFRHLVWHIGILGMIALHYNTQGEDNIEHTNNKCHVFTRGRYSYTY